MTPKQNAFCREMATPDHRGRYRPQHECYRLAFGCTELSAKRQVVELMKKPEIRERVDELRQQVEEEAWEMAKRAPIAVKAHRLLAKQERHDLLRDLIEARKKGVPEIARLVEDLQNERLNLADQLAECDDPEKIKALNERLSRLGDRIESFIAKIGLGEETGLLVRDIKGAGGIVTEVVKFDKAVLDALNEIENDAAKELGQITEKKDITSGGKAFKALVAVDIDAV